MESEAPTSGDAAPNSPASGVRPAFLPQASIEQLRSALAQESRAAARAANVFLGVATVGAAAPIGVLFLGNSHSSLDVLRYITIAGAAALLDWFVFKLYRSSQQQYRSLLAKCIDLEQSSALAQLALRRKRYRLAAKIVMSSMSPEARPFLSPNELPKDSTISSALARQVKRPQLYGSASILELERARKRRRATQHEDRARD